MMTVARTIRVSRTSIEGENLLEVGVWENQ
jgi:hypothetical protein